MKLRTWIVLLVMASVSLLPSLAIAQPATPEPAVTTEVLGTVSIPKELVPSGGVDGYFFRTTLPTEQAIAWPECTGLADVSANLVLAGEGSLTGGHVVRVWHADGTVEAVGVGKDTAVKAGDTYLAVANGPAQVLSAGYPEDLVQVGIELLALGVDPQPCAPNAVPPEYHLDQLAYVYPYEWDYFYPDLTDQPLTITFQRTTLLPGARIPIYESNSVIERYVETGQVDYAFPMATSDVETVRFVQPTQPAHADPAQVGTPAGCSGPHYDTIVNDGDVPAVILEGVIVVGEGESAASWANGTPVAAVVPLHAFIGLPPPPPC